MALYAIIAPQGRPELTAAVTTIFGANCYEFSPGQFMVKSTDLTAQGITQAIGAGNGELGYIAVFSVANYWGYHNRELWEWLTIEGVIS